MGWDPSGSYYGGMPSSSLTLNMCPCPPGHEAGKSVTLDLKIKEGLAPP